MSLLRIFSFPIWIIQILFGMRFNKNGVLLIPTLQISTKMEIFWILLDNSSIGWNPIDGFHEFREKENAIETAIQFQGRFVLHPTVVIPLALLIVVLIQEIVLELVVFILVMMMLHARNLNLLLMNKWRMLILTVFIVSRISV